ncbi:hypothetical protein Tco_0734788 [Tanacetum coccineum]
MKEQVKEQVKAQVSKILPKIEKTVNEKLEAEVLTRLSNESKTSHAVAANLSELELKKILMDKMKSNKSIYRSNEQKNLYKASVDAYESDKLILDTYGDTGSKRRRAGKEPESTSALKEKNSKTIGKSTKGSKSHHKSADKSAKAEEPMHTAKDLEEPAHQDSLATKEDTRNSFNKLMDTPLDFLAFVMNRLKVDTLNPELLAGPTFELMKGSSKSLVELKYFLKKSTRSFVIQRRVEDLQLGVESYQKKLNLTRPDINGTLNDVRTALDDILKRIRMKYLPQTYWKKVDKDRAGAMIQAIDKMLKNRRIMRSLEKIVGGRPYEGDFRLLQRTI